MDFRSGPDCNFRRAGGHGGTSLGTGYKRRQDIFPSIGAESADRQVLDQLHRGPKTGCMALHDRKRDCRPRFGSRDRKFVVCDPNPAKNDPGIGLKLTQALPKSDIPDQSSAMQTAGGWLVELADGTLCRPATGARGVIAGKIISYYCEKGKEGLETSLLDGLTTEEPVWTAEKATILPGPQGPKLIESETIAVKTVWQ